MTINFNELKKEIPYKYKTQSCKYGKATMVAYIDARSAQDLLDEVVGPENWQTKYEVINSNLYCSVGIKVERENGSEWVWKTDCGIESMAEKEKGESSDAFKRACVQWGIGRFLYRKGIIELPTKDYKGKERPATREGKILWSADEINKYINSLKDKSTSGSRTQPRTPSSEKYEKPQEEPKYNKHEYQETTIKRVTSLNINGKKGKECLKDHLGEFNKAKKTSFKKIQDLDDKTLNLLIDFIEETKPDDI